jgi:transglutaminase-like putative cysteine protease
MRKPYVIVFTLAFITVSTLFMALSDKRFLWLFPFIFLCYLIEGKVENHSLQKSIEAVPLIFFIFLIISGINLFYILSLLLFVLMLTKFILKKEKKDYYEIFVVGCLTVLLASVSTISISFAVLLFLFLLSGTFMLMGTQVERKNFRVSWGFVRQILLFSAVSFVFSFALFFSFPRLSLGYFHGINLSPQTKSGFSEEVKIQNGEVDLDKLIVMRIESKKNYSPLYITGMHYLYFDGKSWRKDIGRIKVFPYDNKNDFGITQGMEKFTVYLEPLGTTVLFGPDHLTGIHGEFLYLRKNHSGDFFTDVPYYKTVKYDAFSSVPGKSPIELIERIDKNKIKDYLQLPPLPEEFTILSKEIVKDGKSTYEKAKAIENYLQKNYRYSLNPSATSILDFVLNKKSGYCEHFATAFVLMLRENGIPARLVSGFVTSEYNERGKYFIVRAKDAHTWAEVYTDNAGWIRFDPTPQLTNKVTSSKFALVVDSIKMSWYRNVITYNSARQLEIFRNVQKSIQSTGSRINNLFSIFSMLLKKWRLYAIFVAITSLAMILLKKEKTGSDKIGSLIIGILGNDRYKHETLVEYAKRKGKMKELESIIKEYYKLRFSGGNVDQDSLVKFLKQIKSKM